MVKHYVKKPVTVEAVEFKGLNFKDIHEFVGDNLIYGNDGIYIRTLEGNMFVSPGDFVIKGVHGEFYPCKPDIFEETYMEVEEPDHSSEDEK